MVAFDDLAKNSNLLSKPMSLQVTQRILPNSDGLTLNFSLVSEKLKQSLESLNIRHSDYADIKTSAAFLTHMVEAKKVMRVGSFQIGCSNQKS